MFQPVMRWFYTQFEEAARPDHPVMKYMLLREGRRRSRAYQVLSVVAVLIILFFLLLLGYSIANPVTAQTGVSTPDDPNILNKIFLILYWPLVIIQIPLRLTALGSTVGVVSQEMERGTWDTLKITTDGAKLTIKTRFWTVFYRLRWALILIALVRIYLVVAMLINLMQFQGHYLDLLLSGTTPFGPPNFPENASVIVGILIAAVMMTVALLAPFSAIAFDASLGMFIGTLARGRFVGILFRVLLLLGRVVIIGGALYIGAGALGLNPLTLSFLPQSPANPALVAPDWQLWIGAFFGIGEGDLGLTLVHPPHIQHLFADINYGALVGVALLGYIILEAWLSKALINWTANRVTRADKI